MLGVRAGVRAGPREARPARATGVDNTDAARQLDRTLPGDGNTQGSPAGAATAVLQLDMALLQPICAVHARRAANSAEQRWWLASGDPKSYYRARS
jgi:hypothetical protein